MLPAGALLAQPQSLQFDVVSIKRNISGDPSWGSQTFAEGSYRAKNMTARTVVLEAFGLQSFAVGGGPEWFDTERFDVIARLQLALARSTSPRCYVDCWRIGSP